MSFIFPVVSNSPTLRADHEEVLAKSKYHQVCQGASHHCTYLASVSFPLLASVNLRLRSSLLVICLHLFTEQVTNLRAYLQWDSTRPDEGARFLTSFDKAFHVHAGCHDATRFVNSKIIPTGKD